MLREALLDPDLSVAALELLAEANDHESAERIAMIAQNFFKPPAWRIAAARALHRLGDPRGVQVLVALMRAFRSHGRSDAVQAVGELGLHDLGGELLKLAHRPRGTDPATLVTALEALHSESDEARQGLQHMARRTDAAGERARAALAQVDAHERT
jgi:HEAT repeat protein